MAKVLKVAMIGYGFMGKVHSNAWRSVNHFFPEAPQVEMTVICGRSAQALEAARVQFGWKEAETDWKAIISRSDIDIVDICTAGDMHEEIAIAALRAGKHVICEKPLANNCRQRLWPRLQVRPLKKALNQWWPLTIAGFLLLLLQRVL